MSDRVMISMPFRYRNKNDLRLLDRAVSSVMEQTHQNITLMLVVDGGGKSLGDIDLGGKVIVHHLVESHGRYFIDAATLRAAITHEFDYWMVHDSDDWTDPDHVEQLVSKMMPRRDLVLSGYVKHTTDGDLRTSRFNVQRARRLHSGTQYGTVLWRPTPLMEIGGPNPDWRVAWDTMLISLSVRFLRYGVSNHAGYHYEIHRGSLSQDAQTGMRSQYRKALHRERQKIWYNAQRHARSRSEVGAIVRRTIKDETMAMVQAESERLAAMIEPGVAT